MVKIMPRSKSFLYLSLFSLTLLGSSVLQNLSEVRSFFGLDRYPYRHDLANLKIAVIDNGFEGYDPAKNELPASTKLVLKYDAELINKFHLDDPNYQNPPAATEHGKVMAQIIWGITGGNVHGPQFYLLNANGITNFRRAVRYAIEEKVDIVLYAQNRECCGNFNGEGFLNAIVNQATNAGILWINAAGNYGGQVYNDSIQSVSANGLVNLSRGTELRIKSHFDENAGQVILNWNSNGPEEDSGTDKDIDLYLYDEKDQLVAKSEYKQVLKKAKLAEDESFLPRERIRFDFVQNKTGVYRLVLKSKSNNFNSNDRVRIVVIPERSPTVDPQSGKSVEALEFLDATHDGEIMVPADNPNVITVGDLESYSALGPTADGRIKPEIVLETSVASFSNGQSHSGSSEAAAYFAGIAAILKSYQPRLTREELIAFPRKRISTLGAQIEKVSFAEFANQHGEMLGAVEELSGESPILAGRYTDGRYVLGSRKNPAEFLKEICPHSSTQNVEYYLAYRNPYVDRYGRSHAHELTCHVRSLGNDFQSAEPYPWENEEDKRYFIEIRQVYYSVNRGTLNGIWVTPTPEQLGL